MKSFIQYLAESANDLSLKSTEDVVVKLIDDIKKVAKANRWKVSTSKQSAMAEVTFNSPNGDYAYICYWHGTGVYGDAVAILSVDTRDSGAPAKPMIDILDVDDLTQVGRKQLFKSASAKKSYVEDAKKHLNAIRDYLKK